MRSAALRVALADHEADGFVDAQEAIELGLDLGELGDLDEERGRELIGLGNQVAVGVDLVLDLLGIADALHSRHLLDLVTHRLAVLEEHGDLLTHGHPPVAFVCQDSRAVLGTNQLIAVELQDVVEDDARHAPSPSPSNP
jgi:hypothetical protein